MLALAYDAALRREELCSLRTDDLDPAHRTLRVRAETTKNASARSSLLPSRGTPTGRYRPTSALATVPVALIPAAVTPGVMKVMPGSTIRRAGPQQQLRDPGRPAGEVFPAGVREAHCVVATGVPLASGDRGTARITPPEPSRIRRCRGKKKTRTPAAGIRALSWRETRFSWRSGPGRPAA
ncbi:hypothetical protein [Streptomyces violaceusniger]